MKRVLVFLTTLSLLLSACSPAAMPSSSGVQAWLDQPVSGSILPLGAFPVKAHARHADGLGITRIEILVDGVPIGAVDTDPAAAIVFAEVPWNASTPGEYSLVARAYAGDETGDSLPVRVCVSQAVSEPVIAPAGGCEAAEVAPGSGTDITPTATTIETATFTPTATVNLPAADTVPPAVDITLISPDTLYYGSGCSASSGILTVEAYVTDSGSGVGDVYLVYGFVGAGAEGIFASMAPIGGGYYRATIDIGAQGYTFYAGANGEIGIAVIGNDLAGNSAQDTGSNVPLLYCPG
jgi:hypothetical protein